MLKNYIKIAWRSLVKHKLYSAIKIGGFAFSIAACIWIALYVIHELSYDRTYPHGERIFRVVGVNNNNGTISKGTTFPAPLSKAIEADFPEVELSGRLMPNSLFYGAGSNQVTTQENSESIYEEGFTYVDQELLDILSLPMIYGVREHALDKPQTVVITASKAEKFFPDQNPIGKVMYLNGDHSKPYTVTGVLADLPSTSHLNAYQFFLTLSGVNFYEGEQDNWGADNYVQYLKLKKGTDPKYLEEKATSQIIQKYAVPMLRKTGMAEKEINRILTSISIQLQPVEDIHLYSSGIDDYKHVQRGDIHLVWLFSGIALFILIIASINFINLSTAKSADRAKEVGLRKVVGSYRRTLITQFLTESAIYSFISIFVGLILAWIALPLFNMISGKDLIFPWSSLWFFPTILACTLLIGFLSGVYPALYLSGFRPIAVLKGQLNTGNRNSLLRNGLVIFQFAASILLIIGTMIINGQMHYILNKKIGFNKDQVLILQGTNTLGKQIKAFKDELEKIPQVKSASVGDYLPIRMGGVKRNGNTFYREGKMQEDTGISGQFWNIDEDYLKTFGMKLVKGRNLSLDRATDSQAVIINEAMARALRLKEPVGARITNGRTYTVVGIVQDFNFESLRGTVSPLCLALGDSPTMMAVKLQPSHMKETLQAIAATWKSFAPNQAFRYAFLDEGYANMYADVQQTGAIFTSFAILAIFIACLGLFGLAAFTTEQRTKEIGIRKVLGASVNGIVQLLSRDFIKLVFAAIVIASPLAWWAMNKWLEDFAYRIEISWWVFVLAGLAAVIIALVTVSYQAIKAALANPTKSLRSE